MLVERRFTRLASVLLLSLAGLVSIPGAATAAEPTLASPTSLPSSFPYQPELREFPENLGDQSIPRGAIPYHEIAPTLNEWMDESDIISTQVVGQSYNGYDLHMVTITAPETEAETAQQELWKHKIKYAPAAAAEDETLQAGYKQPIWFNSNIHGNEWEGTDGSLHYIEWLLENEDAPEVQELLDHYRLYFTVTNNPDGRILGQRPNGAGFDLNRDFVTNSFSETQIIRDLTASIQPLFFSDLHGYTNVLQIEPCGPPHGENYDYDLFLPHAYASALKIEQDVVDAEIPGNTYMNINNPSSISTTKSATHQNIKIPYRDTPSGWDDWPPVFTAQYVAFQGAIASTVELPLGRSSNPTTHLNNGLVDQEVMELVIDSTVEYVVDNGDELLDNQIEIFRRGLAGEPLREIPANPDPTDYPGPDQWAAHWGPEDVTGTTFPRAYVIPVGESQKSATDATFLVNHLRKHNVEVVRATAPFSAGGTSYPAGSFVVDMHQPLRGLANAILAAGSDISRRLPSMYDISAWSHGYLWGATVDRIGDTEDPALSVDTTPVTRVTGTGSVPTRTGGFLEFDLAGVDAFRALNFLLGEDVPVTSIGDGTAVLASDAASRTAATAAAEQFGVRFTRVDGTQLAAPDAKPLERLTVGWAGSSTDDLFSLRAMGFAEDQLVPISATTINSGAVDLSQIDVIYLGSSLTFNGTQTAGTAAMQAYIDSGKGFVGRGTNANNFANTWLGAASTAVSGVSSGNGVVKVATDPEGPLGPLDTEWAFVYPAVSFALGSGTGHVEQTYVAAKNEADYVTSGDSVPVTILSGHWRRTTATNGPDYAVGRASVYSAEHAVSGAKGLVFGTAVTFRTHPRGHFSEILTGLYWAAPAASEGLVAPTVSTTSLTLSPRSQRFGGTPAQAIVRVDTAEPVASRAGTVEILAGDRLIATGNVDESGRATIALPATLDVGSYELEASYVAREGVNLTYSSSGGTSFVVERGVSATSLALSATEFESGAVTPVTATVTVTSGPGLPVPTGTVDLLLDGTTVASGTLVDGVATVDVPTGTAPGDYAVTAAYVPASSAPYAASVSTPSSLRVTGAGQESVTTVSAPAGVYGTGGTVTVDVTGGGAPAGGGTVTLTGAGAALTAPVTAGTATFTLPADLGVGEHPLTASYSGTEDLLASTGTATYTVARGSVRAVTFKVAKAPTPKRTGKATVAVATARGLARAVGEVTTTLRKGGKVRTVTADLAAGKATFRLPRLGKGVWRVRVVYGGSDTYERAASRTYPLKIRKRK